MIEKRSEHVFADHDSSFLIIYSNKSVFVFLKKKLFWFGDEIYIWQVARDIDHPRCKDIPFRTHADHMVSAGRKTYKSVIADGFVTAYLGFPSSSVLTTRTDPNIYNPLLRLKVWM